MSSLPDGGRHRKAQALPLYGMARNKAGYSGGLTESGSKKAENVEERVEMAKVYGPASSLKASGIEATSV